MGWDFGQKNLNSQLCIQLNHVWAQNFVWINFGEIIFGKGDCCKPLYGCDLSQNQDNQFCTLKLTNCNCFYSKFEGGRRVSVKFSNAEIVLTQHSDRNSILLHSGLNPAWHFWSENEISWEHFRLYLRTILQIFERL